MTRIPKARDTSWAIEAGRAWADEQAARPFTYHRADPATLAQAIKDGTADVVAREGDRIDAVKRAGLAPLECGPDVVLIAPARGPVIASMPREFYPEGERAFKAVDAGYRGRMNMRQEDVFDRMHDQARRAKGAAFRTDDAPFTKAQIGIARDYRALFEAVQAGGIKCSADLSGPTGGGDGRDFMDLYMQKSARLRWAHRRIGTGVAKEVRRVRPSRAGVVHATIPEGALSRIGRRLITRLDLVQMVCIHDKSLKAVLEAHHWRDTGANRKSLREALRAILDDLSGI